jgi:hypothetical protein
MRSRRADSKLETSAEELVFSLSWFGFMLQNRNSVVTQSQ